MFFLVFASQAQEITLSENNRYLSNTIPKTQKQSIHRTVVTEPINEKPASNQSIQIAIKGKVTDEKGNPLAGANVLIKGSKAGTMTNEAGTFTLNIKDPATTILVVSYTGMEEKEVRLKEGQDEITVMLTPTLQKMEDVVVVGYGTQKIKNVSGAVSSLKGSELTSAPAANAAGALQGRVSGVMAQNSSGNPSGDVTIRIRGANSLTYGNDPLVIIDGVQGGNIASLNPNDVESIEVLKDASALSIYGSRGANGVLLVTTKTGKSSKMKVALNSYAATDKVRRELPALNAKDYATLVNTARQENGLGDLFLGDQIAAMGAGTNWQNEIFKEGFTQNHSLSVSGLSNGTSYYISGNLLDRKGVVMNTGFTQYTLRTNFKLQASKRLKLLVNAFYAYDITHNGNYESAIQSALQWAPTKTVYNDDGTYTQPGGGVGPTSLYNPVGYAKEGINDLYNTDLNLAPTLEFKITDHLKFSSQAVYKLKTSFSGTFDNQVVNAGPASNVYGSVTQGRTMSLQSTNVLNFTKRFDKHLLDVTGVYEILKDQYRGSFAAAYGIPVGLGYNGLSFGSNFQPPVINLTNTALMSFMARINYSYDNKYMITFSDRYDGASQLADGNKFENFNALSLGWNITEEKWMRGIRPIFPELKLRASYGQVGNAAVPALSSQLLFNAGLDVNSNPVLSIKQLSNPDLRWERTTEYNVGMDAKVINNKIGLSFEYYDKTTRDLLMWQTVPAALGVTSVLRNIGAVSNKGIDLSLSGTILSSNNFNWTSNFTFNYNQNKILQLDGLSDTLYYSSNADYPGVKGSFVQMKGQPMGTFLGYQYAGVWKQNEISTAALYGAKPGDAKYVDENKDGKIDKNDIVVIGNAQPKYVFGWNNTIVFKNFDANIFFQGVTGNSIYNQNRIRREAYTSDAFPTDPLVKNHYTISNQQTEVPAFNGVEMLNSSRWVEDGSYLRLKNVSLGYKFDEKLLEKTKIFSAIRFYVSASNLLTVTKYTGFDPEASIGKDASAAGVDRSVYPSQKSFVIGLNASF
jgi:TonB-linked SusC/RagA family outer membrane protein